MHEPLAAALACPALAASSAFLASAAASTAFLDSAILSCPALAASSATWFSQLLLLF